jgi:hypothetical protein
MGYPEIDGAMLGAPVGPPLGIPVGTMDGVSLAKAAVRPSLGTFVVEDEKDGASVGIRVTWVGASVVRDGVSSPLELLVVPLPLLLPCKLLLALALALFVSLFSLLFLDSALKYNGTKMAQAITTIVDMRRRTLTAALIVRLGPPTAADDRDSDMLDAVVLDGDTAALAGAVAVAVAAPAVSVVARGGIMKDIENERYCGVYNIRMCPAIDQSTKPTNWMQGSIQKIGTHREKGRRNRIDICFGGWSCGMGRTAIIIEVREPMKLLFLVPMKLPMTRLLTTRKMCVTCSASPNLCMILGRAIGRSGNI